MKRRYNKKIEVHLMILKGKKLIEYGHKKDADEIYKNIE